MFGIETLLLIESGQVLKISQIVREKAVYRGHAPRFDMKLLLSSFPDIKKHLASLLTRGPFAG